MMSSRGCVAVTGALVAAVFAIACGGGDELGAPGAFGGDASTASDASTTDEQPRPDSSAPAPPDASANDAPSTCVPGANAREFVLRAMTLPTTRAEYAFDLNGDGTVDNQFGGVLVGLGGLNLGSQGNVDAAIAAGTDVVLFAEISSDAQLVSDACAHTEVATGNPHPPDAGGGYTIDDAGSAADFAGALAAAAFASTAPASGPDVQWTVKLPLFDPTAPIALPLHGAHVVYTNAGGNLTEGRLHGAIKSEDVQAHFVPALAAKLNAVVQANPSSSDAQQIKSVFDKGNGNGGSCTNPDSSTSAPNDGKIGLCEVAGNALLLSLLAPDVQMFDGSTYEPSAANKTPDSVSFGVAFTAGPASF